MAIESRTTWQTDGLGYKASEPVTPSDTVDQYVDGDLVPNGISVDVSGYVKLGYRDGTINEFYLLAGFVHPIKAYMRVYLTTAGTAATGIHAHI